MCSCSGSCNCNSTTIPRGPQGPPGTNGTPATVTVGSVTPLPAGVTPTVTNSGTNPSAAVFNFGIPAGAPGSPGGQGNNGINAFTTLTSGFVQPPINDDVIINVVNTSWLGEGQIIFVEGDASVPTDAGGYYQVATILTATTVNIIRLNWTIPNTDFINTGAFVGGSGTKVVSSGTIGPDNYRSYVLDSEWGVYTGVGGSSDFKTSLLIPGETLENIGDTLECQTVFTITGASTATRTFSIKLDIVDNNPSGVIATVYNIDVPTTFANYVTIHMNYKIQYADSNKFRSKGECFSLLQLVYSGSNYITNEINKSYMCVTPVGNVTLNGSSDWTQDQYLKVIVNDELTPVVDVIHHEIKVVKKLV